MAVHTTETRTQNIKPFLLLDEALRALLGLVQVAEIEFEPVDLPVPRLEALGTQPLDSGFGASLVTRGNVYFRASTCEVLNGREADPAATFSMVVSGRQASLTARTNAHLPPVTITTFPVKSGKSFAGSNVGVCLENNPMTRMPFALLDEDDDVGWVRVK